MTATQFDIALAAARDGQQDGYLGLFREYSAMVFGLVVGMVKDATDAEELTQDTFLKTFQALPTFHGGQAAFPNFLRRIAYNEAVTWLRRKHPLPTLSLDTLMESAEIHHSTEDTVNRDERAEVIAYLIEQLPAEEQTLLQLYYREDLPIKEIAYIVHSNANTIAQKLVRIRKRLKRSYEEGKYA